MRRAQFGLSGQTQSVQRILPAEEGSPMLSIRIFIPEFIVVRVLNFVARWLLCFAQQVVDRLRNGAHERTPKPIPAMVFNLHKTSLLQFLQARLDPPATHSSLRTKYLVCERHEASIVEGGVSPNISGHTRTHPIEYLTQNNRLVSIFFTMRRISLGTITPPSSFVSSTTRRRVILGRFGEAGSPRVPFSFAKRRLETSDCC